MCWGSWGAVLGSWLSGEDDDDDDDDGDDDGDDDDDGLPGGNCAWPPWGLLQAAGSQVVMVLMMGMGRAGGILAGIFLGCLKITALKYTFICFVV